MYLLSACKQARQARRLEPSLALYPCIWLQRSIPLSPQVLPPAALLPPPPLPPRFRGCVSPRVPPRSFSGRDFFWTGPASTVEDTSESDRNLAPRARAIPKGPEPRDILIGMVSGT